MNSSATGGYLLPSDAAPELTLTQFIQTVIVGITGFDSKLVRPRWQIEPPKQPGIEVNWVAFGIDQNMGDANAQTQLNGIGPTSLRRQEMLSVRCSFYGPNALENTSAFRDGFQITQNLEALLIANMGFQGFSSAVNTADFFNERWYNRYDITLELVRQVQRTYQVLSFASASGIIHTVLGSQPHDIPFSAEAT